MSGTPENTPTRAGALALSIIGAPVDLAVLEMLKDTPASPGELQRRLAAPPTTMRRHTRLLAGLGLLERDREPGFSGSTRLQLSPAGRDLHRVIAAVRDWLGKNPAGPAELASPMSRALVKTLVDAWSTSMLRALAARPLSLTELDRVIPEVSYPSLERRLAALRSYNLVQGIPSPAGGTRAVATTWLRQSVLALAAAARWENQYLAGKVARPTTRDIETGFLLALPLLRLPAECSGDCRLAVQLTRGDDPRYAGAFVRVEEGEVVSAGARLQGEPDAWASGSTADWTAVLLGGDPRRLDTGGDTALASNVVDGLVGIFSPRRRTRRDAAAR